ncbi:MAG: hypothetical protein HYS61_07295 [Acidobacteria bacterium]|nr:hypothetical protein [Acidobacteriota bacterium]
MKIQSEFQKHVAQRSFFSVAALPCRPTETRKAKERALRYKEGGDGKGL